MFSKYLLMLIAIMLLSTTGSSQEPLEAPASFTAEAPTMEVPIVGTVEAPTVGSNLPPGYTTMLDNTTQEAFIVAENGTRFLAAKEILGPCGPCCCGYRVRIKGDKGTAYEGLVGVDIYCIWNLDCMSVCRENGLLNTQCRGGDIVAPGGIVVNAY
jgi:hypothetical protein